VANLQPETKPFLKYFKRLFKGLHFGNRSEVTALPSNKKSSGPGLLGERAAMAVNSAEADYSKAIDELSYRETQAKLKELGIPAKG
jgi:hypothetical protein